MTQITRVPKGLQDLLGTQAFGKNPAELAQNVLPQLDLFPFYGAERLRYQRVNAPVAARGNGPGFTVPIGKIWIPVGMSVQFVNGPAVVNFMLGVTIEEAVGQLSPTIPVEIFGTRMETSAVVGDQFTHHFWFPQNFVLQGDTILRSQVNALDVGSPVSFLEFQMWYYEFGV